MFNLSDVDPRVGPMGELIEDGTLARVKLRVRAGGADGEAPGDRGKLKASNTSDAKMLDCEIQVLGGNFAGKRFWHMFAVSGGKTDKNGQSIAWNISKAVFRGMIDSACNLHPDDKTEDANAKRRLNALSDLDGIEFAARIMVEHQDNDYPDQNRIANVILPDHEHYQAIMNCQHVPPEPVKQRAKKQQTQENSKPAWDNGGGASGAVGGGGASGTAGGGGGKPPWMS